MDEKAIRDHLLSLLQQQAGITISSFDIQPIGGGSINDTYRLTINSSRSFFLKTNKAARYPGLFKKEKEGLEYLAQQQCIHIPRIIFFGETGDEQMLLLEWIAPGQRTTGFWKKFGEQLALLHRKTQPDFGLATDNYMGALPQTNTPGSDWTNFFINQRLAVQVKLGLDNNLLPRNYIELFEQLYKKLDAIFDPEPPSLLHGDLWSGNFICNQQAEPVLIDPAIYYGHRSIDLGMTTLFGGYERPFYDSYHYHFPLPPNYEEQWKVCNLYPLLIHLNLFGQSYLGNIADTLKRFQ